jgi:hypothetical protein
MTGTDGKWEYKIRYCEYSSGEMKYGTAERDKGLLFLNFTDSARVGKSKMRRKFLGLKKKYPKTDTRSGCKLQV